MGTLNTGAIFPTTTGSPSNDFAKPAEILVEDGKFATSSTVGHQQDTATYGFSIPSDNVITGMLLEAKARGTGVGKGIVVIYSIAASWDGGTSYTTVFTETARTLLWRGAGGEFTGLGGHAWVPDEISDANFRCRVKVESLTGLGATLEVDAVRVTIWHRAKNVMSEGGAAKTGRQVIMG